MMAEAIALGRRLLEYPSVRTERIVLNIELVYPVVLDQS